MAEFILAGEPLARNEIYELADTLEEIFDSYLENPRFIEDYLKILRTLIGLGFTATLVDKSQFLIYQHYLKEFMHADAGHFKDNPSAKRYIAQCCSEMIAIALISFDALQNPGYYWDFVKALDQALPASKINRHVNGRSMLLSHLKKID